MQSDTDHFVPSRPNGDCPGGTDGDLITVSCDSDSLVQRNDTLPVGGQGALLSRSSMKWQFDIMQ